GPAWQPGRPGCSILVIQSVNDRPVRTRPPGRGRPTGRPETSGMSSAPRTILVVDDNEKLAALVEKYLRRDGFRSAHVPDGAAALAWLGGQHADLLLLNLKLPDMTGEEVVQTLEERKQAVPFIVVSGHG